MELFIKKLSLVSQKYGFGIRNPGSGPGVKQTPGPDPQHWNFTCNSRSGGKGAVGSRNSPEQTIKKTNKKYVYVLSLNPTGPGRGEDRDPEAFSGFPEAAGGEGADGIPPQAGRFPQARQRA